jgi:photosystem II stability/assembly factor-like uncharacterized protein
VHSRTRPTALTRILFLVAAVPFLQSCDGNGDGGTGVGLTQGGWVRQNSSAIGTRVQGLEMASASTGFALTLGGQICRTTDGGEAWTRLSTGATDDLRGFAFVNTETGCAVGDRGTILWTDDGGITWRQQTAGDLGPAYFEDVSVQSTTKATVVGQDGMILRTTDGGETWILQPSGSAARILDVDFLDDTIGAALTRDSVLTTVNGGATWTRKVVPGSSGRIAIKQVTSQTIAIVTGRGPILRSVDGGDSWEEVPTGISGPEEADFSGAGFGMVVGIGGIARTTNGGGIVGDDNAAPFGLTS